MAMIASAFLPGAACSLAGMLADGTSKALGVADELLQLKGRIDEAEKLVNGAEAMGIYDPAIRKWLHELREALYMVDDTVDDYRRCAEEAHTLQEPPRARKSIRDWFGLSADIGRVESKSLNSSIKSLNRKMDDILKKKSDFGFLPTDLQNQNERSVCSRDLVSHHDIVGDVERQKLELVEILTDMNSADLLVAIVGTAGIGKTTLARKMYEDPCTRKAFSITVWVCVSSDFTDMRLLSAIITAAGGNPRQAQSREQLETLLATIFAGKRFLLVLDNMSNGQIFEDLPEAAFRCGVQGSRVLVTTRDEGVAIQMKAAYIHKVHQLTFQDCWSLLCSNACLDEDRGGEALRETGIMIMQKCNKLPLAIKIVGGVLRTRGRTREEWQRVYESEEWSFKDLPEGMQGVMGAIYLGYNDLSSHLKQCFLYCSLFPVGDVIKRHLVTQLWISEGFVEERDDCTHEEIAEEYYRELISRNLLQPETGAHDITRCTMHDRIRSFVQFLTKDEISTGELKRMNDLSVQLRHVLIGKNRLRTIPKEIGTLTSLRTLILYKNPLGDRGMDTVLRSIKSLRVLNLAGTDIRHVPRTIGNLVHLRLLNLSLTRIMELPESIEGLRNLQFLGLQRCSWLHCLPIGIEKLQNLRDLDLRGTTLHQVLPRLRTLEQLNRLHGFVVNHKAAPEEDQSGWPLEDLKSLDGLRSLQILKIERVFDCSRAQEAMLANKSQLKELELCCSTDDRQLEVLEEDATRIKAVFNHLCPPECLESLKIVSYSGKLCPDWISVPHLSNLKQLYLADCKFCESLPALGQLPQLRLLTIISCPKLRFIKQEQTGTNRAAFPRLEELYLKEMQNLESWTGCVTGDLPSLLKFHLKSCPKLRSLPSNLRHSATLTSMQILYAESLEAVEDLPVLKELLVRASANLIKISNLPLLEVLTVIGCPRLQYVKQVHYLRHLHVEDRDLRELPDWLERHASVLQTLTIVGTADLLGRLLPNSEDWPTIREIAHVYANLPDESHYFTYTKSTANFHVYQRMVKQGDLSGANADEMSSISLPGNSVEIASQTGVRRAHMNKTTRLKEGIRRKFIPSLIITLFGVQFILNVLQKKMTGQLVLIQNFVFLIATVFLMSFFLLD